MGSSPIPVYRLDVSVEQAARLGGELGISTAESLLAASATPAGYAALARVLGAAEDRMEGLVRQAERLTGKRYLRAAGAEVRSRLPDGVAAGRTPAGAAGASVLVADQDKGFRGLFGAALRSRFPNLPVLEARTADEALWKVRRHAPRIVFADLRLPGGSGSSLPRTICEEHPEICAVVTLGGDVPEHREAARASGATHFLSKGRLDLDEILGLVEEAVWGRPSSSPSP